MNYIVSIYTMLPCAKYQTQPTAKRKENVMQAIHTVLHQEKSNHKPNHFPAVPESPVVCRLCPRRPNIEEALLTPLSLVEERLGALLIDSAGVLETVVVAEWRAAHGRCCINNADRIG